MELKEYKGTKNDLVIGLVHRFTLSDKTKTININLCKVDNGFEISQWAMDDKGEDIESYRITSKPIKKKYYAMQEIKGMIKKYIPTYGERKVFTKKRK